MDETYLTRFLVATCLVLLENNPHLACKVQEKLRKLPPHLAFNDFVQVIVGHTIRCNVDSLAKSLEKYLEEDPMCPLGPETPDPKSYLTASELFKKWRDLNEQRNTVHTSPTGHTTPASGTPVSERGSGQ